MSKNEKRSEMFSIVRQLEESGMSQRAFSRVNGISQTRQQQKLSSGFVQLNESAIADICLRYPNGVELLLSVHTPISLIKGLINL